MPKPFPQEFRRDVIAVARQGDKSIAQVARSFGISQSCLNRWLKIAAREDGLAGPTSATPTAGGGGDAPSRCVQAACGRAAQPATRSPGWGASSREVIWM